ncbi:hypothetical protein [Virgibacillus proomii]|uniref:hypothetical protein n=1 Tax=Virgibacillus proomii TaxID=84407 RepID=UPI001C0F57DB|nr:hypothetical protein [Virgibacillus proomii]MBU5265703.1 hypothetical protein [Virgibacillus proomii]
MTKTAANLQANHDWMEELARPEIQSALTNLIRLLPELERTFHSIEQITQFSKYISKDTATIKAFEQRFQLSKINEESFEALITILGKLPILLQIIELMEQITLFIKNVLADEQSLEQLKASLFELSLLNQRKEVKELIAAIQERKNSMDHSISIFTIMKWIKEPKIQNYLKYIQATLDVLQQKHDE